MMVASIEAMLELWASPLRGVKARIRGLLGLSAFKRGAVFATIDSGVEIYDEPEAEDGERILVDRLWPRGCRKEKAKLDAWMKDVALSGELRRCFDHKPERWAKFKEHYQAEWKDNSAFDGLRERAATKTVTLLYGSRNRNLNQAAVLAEFLADRC